MKHIVDNNPHLQTWFRRVPRHFFNFPLWSYSFYVGFGYFLTGILHFRIWKQSNQVETIFTIFSLDLTRPTPISALLFFVFTGMFATLIFYLLFRRVRREAGILELVFWGTFCSLSLAWIPWLYASSVVSTVFLFLFGMISLTGFGLASRLLSYDGVDNQILDDSWKMFVNATKACTAMIALLLGAIATSVLLPWRNSGVEEFELLRYAFLCAYVGFGMLVFILMPLLAKSLDEKPIDDVKLDPPGPL